MVLKIVGSIVMATYTVCLPLLLKWIHQIRKDKKDAHKYMEDSVINLEEKITDLTSLLSEMKMKQEFDEAMASRYRIIRAADEVRHGAELSSDHVEQLGEDVEIYKHYCETHPFYKNHKGKKSMELIESYEDKLLTEVDA